MNLLALSLSSSKSVAFLRRLNSQSLCDRANFDHLNRDSLSASIRPWKSLKFAICRADSLVLKEFRLLASVCRAMRISALRKCVHNRQVSTKMARLFSGFYSQN